MTWTIYSIGDAAFLQQILNAVAAMCATSSMVILAEIGFMVGVIYVSVESLMKGAREIRAQSFLLALISYLCMFGNTVTVAIQDVYSDQSYIVANVPLGVGIPGAMISQIGYGITKLFEQAFSTPSMMNDGFAGSLSLLMDSRSFNKLPPAINIGNGSEDVNKSLANFMANCVDSNLGSNIPQSILESQPSIVDFVKPYMNPADATEMYIQEAASEAGAVQGNSGGGALLDYTVPCPGAQDALSKRLITISNTPQVANAFATSMGCRQSDIQSGYCPKAQQLGDAIAGGTALAQSNDSAQQYMMQMLQAEAYRQGLTQAAGGPDSAALAIVVQGDEQRAVNETANATLFARMVRPMLTFIEGFTYAITPLMMFLVGTGVLGFGMVFKYVQMALWIQLWMPLMAVLNLYVNMVAQGQLDAAFQTGLDPASVLGISNMAQYHDFLATVGIIALAIPGLAMFLVYGGSVAATSLAGKLQAGSFINEKLAAPDIASPAPAFQMASMGTQDNVTRQMQATGSERMLSGISLESSSGNTISNSVAASETASRALSQQTSSVLTQSQNSQLSSEVGQRLTQAYESSGNQSLSTTAKELHDIARGQGLSESQAQQFTAQTLNSISGDVNFSPTKAASAAVATLEKAEKAGGKLGAAVSALPSLGVGLSSREQVGAQTSAQGSSEVSSRISSALSKMDDKTATAALRESTAGALSNGFTSSATEGSGKSEADSLVRSAQAAQSLQRDVRDSTQLGESMRAASNIDPKILNQDMAKAPVQEAINHHLSSGNDQQFQSAYENASRWMNTRNRTLGVKMPEENLRAAAYVMAMSSAQQITNPDGTINASAMHERMQNQSRVLQAAGLVTPQDRSGMNQEVWDGGRAAANDASARTAPAQNVTGVSDQARSAVAGVPGQIDRERGQTSAGAQHSAVDKAHEGYVHQEASASDRFDQRQRDEQAHQGATNLVHQNKTDGLVSYADVMHKMDLGSLTPKPDAYAGLGSQEERQMRLGSMQETLRELHGGNEVEIGGQKVQGFTAENISKVVRAYDDGPNGIGIRKQLERENGKLAEVGDIAVVSYAASLNEKTGQDSLPLHSDGHSRVSNNEVTQAATEKLADRYASVYTPDGMRQDTQQVALAAAHAGVEAGTRGGTASNLGAVNAMVSAKDGNAPPPLHDLQPLVDKTVELTNSEGQPLTQLHIDAPIERNVRFGTGN